MNNAQNFVMLACVALRTGNTNDAAELLTEACSMTDFSEFLESGLQGNIEAIELARSLSKVDTDDEFEGISASFKQSLESAFSGWATSTCSDDDEDDDYTISVNDEDEDEDEDEDLESTSRVTSRSPLYLDL